MSRLHKLSQAKLNSLSEPGLYGDGGNLCFKVAPGGSTQWVFRYTINQRTRWYGIGPYPVIGLDEARDKAHGLRKLLLQGIDPIEHRNGHKASTIRAKTITFHEAAKAYLNTHVEGWRSVRHRDGWESSLKLHVLPTLGNMLVHEIEPAHVISVLDPIWKDKHKTAGKIRQRIEGILDWSRVHGYRNGDNPAKLVSNLEYLLPDVNHTTIHLRAMPYKQVPALMQKLSKVSGSASAALQFTILTACRAGEVTGALWSEVSDNTWTIPANRMKGNKEHIVPLSNGAMAILSRQAKGNAQVFTSEMGGMLTDLSLRRVLRRFDPAATVHGFRSAFRDWAREQTNYPSEIAELALAHTVGNAVTRAYARSTLLSKRIALMNLWASFCLGRARK